MYSAGSPREFCTGVRANDQPGPSILDGQFMRHYDVYFNREKNAVSFVRSNCDEIKTVTGIKQLVTVIRQLFMDIYTAGLDFHQSLSMLMCASILAFLVWKKLLKDRL
jgi:hypothetical protein